MKRISTTKSTAIPDDEIPFTREQLATTLSKKRISIMLDGAIIEYFKAAAGERGYQTLINDTLRKVIAGEQMVNDVRHVVREELAAYKIR
jgi:uncharacterized protein (DUF4415 family)